MPDRAAQVKAFQAFAAEAASFGITSVQAMMTAYPAAEAVAWIEAAEPAGADAADRRSR